MFQLQYLLRKFLIGSIFPEKNLRGNPPARAKDLLVRGWHQPDRTFPRGAALAIIETGYAPWIGINDVFLFRSPIPGDPGGTVGHNAIHSDFG